MQPRISIILPIYNQSDQISFLFDQYTTNLPRLGVSWELLFVVNGSRDDSYQKALEISKGHPHVFVFNLDKGGWGRAVKFGLSKAKGQLVCYTNSARTNIDDLILVLTYALANDKVVIKTTRVVRENFIRKAGSILYNYENRLLLGTPLWDVNGTPKVIPAAALEGIELISDGDLIDAELMAKIYRRQYQIVEILIVSTKRVSGKSTTGLKSALKMYAGLFYLRKVLK
ncbi:MAG: glycosyltransferase [Chitinophagales bacterium]|nr:glycosyltransferase [Chitinophagales bacterium]MDW8273828.1 glycosyltransferase [Chitinophagales bacterium]